MRNLDFAQVKNRVSVDENFWNAVRGNLGIVDDVKQWQDICCCEVTPVMEDEELTQLAAQLLPFEPWNEDTFNTWINEIKAHIDRKGKALFHPLRKAVTGMDNGPELKVLLPLIGRERVYKRLMGEKA